MHKENSRRAFHIVARQSHKCELRGDITTCDSPCDRTRRGWIFNENLLKSLLPCSCLTLALALCALSHLFFCPFAVLLWVSRVRYGRRGHFAHLTCRSCPLVLSKSTWSCTSLAALLVLSITSCLLCLLCSCMTFFKWDSCISVYGPVAGTYTLISTLWVVLFNLVTAACHVCISKFVGWPDKLIMHLPLPSQNLVVFLKSIWSQFKVCSKTCQKSPWSQTLKPTFFRLFSHFENIFGHLYNLDFVETWT